MHSHTYIEGDSQRESIVFGTKGSNRRREEQERWRVDTVKLYDTLEYRCYYKMHYFVHQTHMNNLKKNSIFLGRVYI